MRTPGSPFNPLFVVQSFVQAVVRAISLRNIGSVTIRVVALTGHGAEVFVAGKLCSIITY